MHSEGCVADWSVFEDADGGEAFGAGAVGESRVVEGKADVKGDDGVEAEGFVHGVLCAVLDRLSKNDCVREISRYRVKRGSYLEIFHVLEIIVGGWSVKAHSINNFSSQVLEYLRMPRQLIKRET